MNFYRKKSLTRETVCLAQYMSVSKYSDCKLGPEQSDASFTAIYYWSRYRLFTMRKSAISKFFRALPVAKETNFTSNSITTSL